MSGGLVTIVFTDLVDSTATAARLGADAADELRRAHFSALRSVIVEHGGTEVKNTGDGLMLAFTRPSDAAACAVAMQQASSRAGRRRGHEVAMRVGIAVGEAVAEDGDWFGAPVVEAARLCAAAASGEILATTLVQSLAAGRNDMTFVPRGELELKGLPDPVSTSQIAWSPASDVSGLPSGIVAALGDVFVGRDLDVDRILAARKRSLDCGVQIVLLSGEPGIGKTRLAAEAARTMAADGATVLFGRCDEDLGLAHQPFVEALQHFVATCPLALLQDHVAAWGGELRRIAPELAKRVPHAPEPLRVDPDLEHHRLLEAVAGLLLAVGGEGGVVVVLDDLHWADKGSLVLLRFLTRATDAQVLIVGTYRDTDLDRRHPLSAVLADLRRQENVERISLSGLDGAAVEAFIEAASAQELDESGLALARAVRDETEGNPFFLGQVLRHLAESGAIFQRDGRWTFEGDIEHLGIPDGVREVIGRRLSRLSDNANHALRVAAVIGREFDIALLATAAERTEDEVLTALEEALAGRLVHEVPQLPDHFGFAHALVRDALYDEVSTSRRMRLHRHVAHALELRKPLPLAALAHHYCEAAAAGEGAAAARYARLAGKEALALLAYDDALAHFRRGLDVVDDDESLVDARISLLLGERDALDQMGDVAAARDAAVAAADLARASGLEDRFLEAALASCVGLPPEIDGPAIDLHREALARVPAGDSAPRAQLLARMGFCERFRGSNREAGDSLTEEAVAVARRVGDVRVLVETLSFRHDVIFEPGNLEERLELARELVELDDRLVGNSDVFVLFDYFELGDIEAPAAAVEDMRRRADELRLPALATWVNIWQTTLDLFAGRLDAAEARLLERGTEPPGMLPRTGLQMFAVQLFDLRRQQGRLEEIESLLRDASRSDLGTTDPGAWPAGLALLLAELGQPDELRAHLDTALADGLLEATEGNAFTILVLTLLAEACAYLGDADLAQLLHDRLAPYAGRNVVVMPVVASLGAASHFVGLMARTIGRLDEAVDHFCAAVEMNERMGARPALARSLVELAVTRQRRDAAGDAAGACEALARATQVATDVAMPALLERITAL